MVRAAARIFTAGLVALLLASMSVVSAVQMAPDGKAIERQMALQTFGADVLTFCEDHEGHGGHAGAAHDHDCPFCHKLPHPPRAEAPLAARRLAWAIEATRGGDLFRGPQHLGAHVSARGPPRTV
ncbi:hypothetical protein RM543_10870 [Roseicyclus sp. F158]|uniref:DUF2946 domain-containing protein n=1 Tax=Tropicimonas omnivorans TaxID=3075590 RepID=A0ABU3DHL8_9RHOB|nr:hypothetical protein [Roseicyclus sp. F158]MDT0683190.1 hypothetical protein [Roseicyclus sp. F158]